MRRRHLFHFEHRPVLSTPHGGGVHHHPGWDWMISHRQLVEFMIILVVGAVIFTGSALIQTVPVNAPTAPGSGSSSYDAIEANRIDLLAAPGLTEDHGYDAIEANRVDLLAAPGLTEDHGYDAIEANRIDLLAAPAGPLDPIYDEIESNRVNR